MQRNIQSKRKTSFIQSTKRLEGDGLTHIMYDGLAQSYGFQTTKKYLATLQANLPWKETTIKNGIQWIYK